MHGALANLQHYPDPQYRQLRTALGTHHAIDPAWILPGNGAAELLTWAARDVCESDGQRGNVTPPAIGVLTPAFGDYQRALETFGGCLKSMPVLSPGIAAQIKTLDPDCWQPAEDIGGYIINNPHNPTGALFPVETLLPLVQTGKPVVIDEAFMDFVPPQEEQTLIPWVKDFPNLVILRSLTKFYSLPGLRIGYAIGHPDRLHRWQQWRDPWPVNTLAQAATLAALQDTDFQTQTWAWLPPARQALLEGLSTLAGLHPLAGAANFLLVRSEAPVPPLQERLLQQHQILIRDCLSFQDLGNSYFRVAVRTPEENARLLKGLMTVTKDCKA